MKVLNFVLVLIVISSLFLVGCGGSSRNVQQVQPEMTEVFRPDWWGYGEEEWVEGRIVAFGMGDHHNQRAAGIIAQTNAQNRIAAFLSAELQGMLQESFEAEVAGEEGVEGLISDVTTILRDANIAGTRIIRQQIFRDNAGRFHAFYQVGFSDAQANQAITSAFNTLNSQRRDSLDTRRRQLLDDMRSRALELGR